MSLPSVHRQARLVDNADRIALQDRPADPQLPRRHSSNQSRVVLTASRGTSRATLRSRPWSAKRHSPAAYLRHPLSITNSSLEVFSRLFHSTSLSGICSLFQMNGLSQTFIFFPRAAFLPIGLFGLPKHLFVSNCHFKMIGRVSIVILFVSHRLILALPDDYTSYQFLQHQHKYKSGPPFFFSRRSSSRVWSHEGKMILQTGTFKQNTQKII